MQSHNNTISPASGTQLKTTLLLVAICINAIEFFLPRIPVIPWLKPGLANSITIIWIVRFGAVDALLVPLLRSWIVSFYFGFSLVSFTLSISGGILSTAMMGLLWHYAGRKNLVGGAGLGIVGALFHNIGQLAAVYCIFARNIYLFYQIPAMIGASLVFGGISGIIAFFLLRSPGYPAADSRKQDYPAVENSCPYPWLSPALFLSACTMIFIADLRLISFCAILTTVAVQISLGGSVRALIYPINRFWLLFLCISAIHLFFSYGRIVVAFPAITDEGIFMAAQQSLRLWTWLQISQLLTVLRFHHALFKLLDYLITGRRDSIHAGILAMRLFPDALEIARRKAPAAFRRILRSPGHETLAVIREIFGEIESLITGSVQSPRGRRETGAPSALIKG